ncbi:MAG: hypothetical protein PVI30_04790 [Myxococcales bacterium]
MWWQVSAFWAGHRFALAGGREPTNYPGVKTALWIAVAFVMFCGGDRPAHAQRARSAVSTANMPPGWHWPPTEAMRESGSRCLSAPAAAGVHYRLARTSARIATPVVIPDMAFAGLAVHQVWARRPPVMDCHMALALAQHARLLASVGVREMVTAGFYQPRHPGP